MTYADKNIGIPALLSCLEMVPICLVVWAYPVSPYYINPRNSRESESYLHDTDASPQSYQGGYLSLKAFLSVWNPSETIRGSVFAFKIVTKQVPARSIAAASASRAPLEQGQQQQDFEMVRPAGRP
jgi:hypothetical protein